MSVGTARDEVGVTIPATPYAWPFHGSLTPSRTALVACCDSSWRPAWSGAADALIESLAKAVVATGGVVITVIVTPARGGRRARTADAPVSAAPAGPALLVGFGETLTVRASGVNAFHGSPLDDLLRTNGRTDLLLAGWGLEGPIHSTMRAANDRGYECLLVGDASVANDQSLTFAALDMVRHSGGIFGAYANTQDVIDALSQIPTPVEAS